jgi:hypothetical protein
MTAYSSGYLTPCSCNRQSRGRQNLCSVRGVGPEPINVVGRDVDPTNDYPHQGIVTKGLAVVG